jgi:hypothetical protein
MARVEVCASTAPYALFLTGLSGFLLSSMMVLTSSCTPKLPSQKPPIFSDSFDRPDGTELGPNFRNTAAPGVYRLTGGALAVRGARNHPLWLSRELPRDAVIEFDAWSDSPEGDIKIEAFGDGQSFATSVEYTSTGYVFIHGGWRNHLTALCRMDEHGSDRKTRPDLKVVPGRRYHYALARHGARVEFFIDGALALDLDDPAPLAGPQHQYLGFDNWETSVHFDNLTVRPY